MLFTWHLACLDLRLPSCIVCCYLVARSDTDKNNLSSGLRQCLPCQTKTCKISVQVSKMNIIFPMKYQNDRSFINHFELAQECYNTDIVQT